jgi:hypothetical protein
MIREDKTYVMDVKLEIVIFTYWIFKFLLLFMYNKWAVTHMTQAQQYFTSCYALRYVWCWQ